MTASNSLAVRGQLHLPRRAVEQPEADASFQLS